MIGLYKVLITHKKEKWQINSEVLMSNPEAIQERYYQHKAFRAKGHDPTIEKFDPSKYTFEATLIKELT